MSITVSLILCALGLIAAVLGFAMMAMSGADPEGRLESLLPWGNGAMIAGALAFVGFGGWAILKWLL